MNNNEKLKIIREKLKLSQVEMAAKFDITQSYYSALERGTKEIPASIINHIINNMGVSAIWFYSSVGNIFENIVTSKVTSMEEILHNKKRFENELQGENESLSDIYFAANTIKFFTRSLYKFLPAIVIDDISDISNFQNGLPNEHPLNYEYKEYRKMMLDHLKELEKYKPAIIEFDKQLTNFLAKMKPLDKDGELPQFNSKFWPKK